MKATLNIPKGATVTAEQMERVMTDPVYMVNEFGWTFDPRPNAYPHNLAFKLYDFQEELLLNIINRIKVGKGLMVEKSRDMGASWIALYAIVWCWMFMPGFQALIGSRTEDLVDNKTMDSLFGKIDYILRRLPFLPEGFSMEKDRIRLKIINPMNGNVIKGESASADFGRQGRYRVVLLDEMAFWEAPEESWASCGESTRCRLAITTPPKRPNFAKYLRFSGIIDVVTLHWHQHPLKDEAWYQLMKSEKTPEELAREVDINWEGAITGRVYPEVDHIRVGNFPYHPEWPLYVSHDPGHDPDPHAMGWFQVNPENDRIRLLETFEAPKKIAAWFGPLFGYNIDSEFVYTPKELELINKVKDWKRGSHMGDVYGNMANQVTGTSIYDEWHTHFKIYVNVNGKAVDYETRKRSARQVIMRLDINDTPNNKYFVECIKDARYPDLTENSNRVTPNNKPIHDWTSHLRSMIEYFAVNFEETRPLELEPAGATFQKALLSIQSNRTDDYIIE